MQGFRSGRVFFRNALVDAAVSFLTLEHCRIFFASGRRRTLSVFLFRFVADALFGKWKNQLKNGVFGSFLEESGILERLNRVHYG